MQAKSLEIVMILFGLKSFFKKIENTKNFKILKILLSCLAPGLNIRGVVVVANKLLLIYCQTASVWQQCNIVV